MRTPAEASPMRLTRSIKRLLLPLAVLIPGPAIAQPPKALPHREATTVPLFLPAYSAYGSYLGEERDIAVADVNGDGIPDIVYAAGQIAFYCSPVGVLLGNGDGTFQAAACPNADGAGIVSIAIADMNGDGKPDLIVAQPCDGTNNCATGNVGILLGNGDGTFQSMINNTNGIAGAGLGVVAVADVNNDGHPDVVVFNGSGGVVQVLLGNGDGTLQAAVGYNPPYGDPPSLGTGNMGGAGVDGLVLADINGDGILDIVMLSFCVANNDCTSGLVGFLLGNGDGTFQSSSSSASLLQNTVRTQAYLSNGFSVADLNGDGIPDVVAASSGTSGGDGVASVMIGLGGGAFLAAVTFDSGGQGGVSTGVADVNGDGKPDLIVLNASCPVPMNCPDSSSVAVFLGNGDGTFQPAQSYTSGPYAQGPVIMADVNGDGLPDVVANANQLFILLGTRGQIINTSVSVTAGPDPSLFGQAVTLTAAVSPKGPSPPTGTVTFFDGNTSLGAAALSGGSGSLSTSSLAVGKHSITGAYSGDLSYAASTSPPVSQTVQASPTATGLSSSANPSASGARVTFTATVTSSSGGTPTGTVVFKNGETVLGKGTLTSGAATYTTAKLPVGSNSITAAYTKEGGYLGSTSTPLMQVVLTDTTTSLSSSPNPSSYGQVVEFSAVVSSDRGAPPDGETVTFTQGSTVLGSGSLSGGTATFSTSALSAGTDAVVAAYGGDANLAGSSSKAVKQVVGKASTTTALTSSVNPSSQGQPVTFTATVAPQYGGTPTGSVVFKNGTTTLKSVPLSGGSASYNTSTLAAGAHSIAATYNGSSDFLGSSGALTQTVQ